MLHISMEISDGNSDAKWGKWIKVIGFQQNSDITQLFYFKRRTYHDINHIDRNPETV